MATISISIHWAWVKKELLRTEKIPSRERSSVVTVAENALRLARRLARPKIVAKTARIIASDTRTITVEKGITLTSATLARNLARAQKLHIFAVTIGGALERAASRLMAHDEQLMGYLLDRVGSLAAESLAENTELRMRTRCARKRESCSTRYSPGYCDWPLEEQRMFAKVLDLSKAGISLTDACMMDPRKSISAVIGIGTGHTFQKHASPCTTCAQPTCVYRRPF